MSVDSELLHLLYEIQALQVSADLKDQVWFALRYKKYDYMLETLAGVLLELDNSEVHKQVAARIKAIDNKIEAAYALGYNGLPAR